MTSRPGHRSTSSRARVSARPAPASDTKPLWARPLIWVAGVTVVAFVGAIVIGLSGSGGSETAPVSIDGSALTPLAAPDASVGEAMPVMVGETPDGEQITVGGDGEGRLIGFFAHWCPACRAEVPAVVDWIEAGGLPDGVEVVAVSTAVDRTRVNYPPSRWFDREKWPGRIIVDDPEGTLATAAGLSGFPFWVAVSGDGTVVERLSGGLDQAGLDRLAAAVADVRADVDAA